MVSLNHYHILNDHKGLIVSTQWYGVNSESLGLDYVLADALILHKPFVNERKPTDCRGVRCPYSTCEKTTL